MEKRRASPAPTYHMKPNNSTNYSTTSSSAPAVSITRLIDYPPESFGRAIRCCTEIVHLVVFIVAVEKVLQYCCGQCNSDCSYHTQK